MKHSVTLAVLAPFLLVACQGATAAPEEPAVVWALDPAGDPETLGAAMIEAGAPREEHAELAKGVGEWDVKCHVYMGPGTDPIPMEASASARMVLGGRYLMQDFEGELMGEPFVGVLYMGYDPLKAEYFGVWMDNMGCAPSIATGAEDADGAIDMGGLLRDAMTPTGRPYRHVSKPLGDDRALVQIYDSLPDGSEFLVMEMLYTRAG